MDTPYSLVVLDETGSTQDDARRLYGAASHGGPVLVVAGSQHAGRGRAGAEWSTAPRAIAASLAFRPPWPQERFALISLMAGVAAARVVEAELKWPNDLVRGVAKVGGLLVEGSDDVVVAGLGVNLWWPDPPPGIGAIRSRDPGPEAAVELAQEWAGELLDMASAGPDQWPRDEYRRRCTTIGRRISWEPHGSGVALDIAPDGALVVETDHGMVELRSGVVRHVRTD